MAGTTTVRQHLRGSHSDCRQAHRTRVVWGLANCIKQPDSSCMDSDQMFSGYHVLTMNIHELNHWSSDLTRPDRCPVVIICRIVVIRSWSRSAASLAVLSSSFDMWSLPPLLVCIQGNHLVMCSHLWKSTQQQVHARLGVEPWRECKFYFS